MKSPSNLVIAASTPVEAIKATIMIVQAEHRDVLHLARTAITETERDKWETAARVLSNLQKKLEDADLHFQE